jgi:signal transduction histidine kinase
MLVRDVVHEHGGEVLVESKSGEGTRFEIVLPLT